jgi:UDP-N-acetylmuramyl tripeptide synthase
MSEPLRVIVERDRGQAIARAVQAAVPGDVILVAGKGHEDTQQIGDRRFPFNDRLAVQRALGQGAAP